MKLVLTKLKLRLTWKLLKVCFEAKFDSFYGVILHAIEDGASTFLLSKASLIFSEERIYGKKCYRCQEPILDPTYGCIKCKEYKFYHHKSCTKLLLGFHHPFHPMHPFILFDKSIGYCEK